jgi:hypothetical protein
MIRRTRLLGIALAMTVSLPLLAQVPGGPPGPQGPPGPPPNSRAEVTIAGTVAAVREYPRQSGWLTGQHVILKTQQGSLDVHLGPADVWRQNGFPLAVGDAIEVTGSPTRVGDATAVVAHLVKKDNKAVTLRGIRGLPAEPGGRGVP